MDRKIELDTISEEMFQEIMTAVSTDILNIAKEAQDKINELLIRFNIRCDISLNYGINAEQPIENSPAEATVTVKKKRTSKKSSQDLENARPKKKRGVRKVD